MAAAAVAMLWALDVALREAVLLAAVLFALGGVDDLLIDAMWLRHRRRAALLAALPPAPERRLAVLVPAWDEARVIGAMLRAALSRYDHGDYRILVGCYPNDPATIAEVAAVAATDARVRLVVGEAAGPTTKADCLNQLWRALRRVDAADGRDTHAVVLHDAEDVVHPAELRVMEHHLAEHALVQLPVVPLIDPQRRWVTGHYADEFAESHGRQLVVRDAIAAALPLAGVGCAIRCDALARLAGIDDAPFEPLSLTEDYELGLRVGALGLTGRFVRLRERRGGGLVATRAFFPDNVHAAVVQKARWMMGIALSGWDRTGWGGRWRPAELWMRMRDRRAPLAVLALVLAYGALVAAGLSLAGHAVAGTAPPPAGPWMQRLLAVNGVILAWRLGVRAFATASEHGWREGVRAVPRVMVANYIAVLAARRAVSRYVALLAGGRVRWDKTAHRFPEQLPAA